MSVPPTAADCARQPRRRWLRVSLRTLLVLVTMLAVWLGWYANRTLRQRQAVASIVAQGGKVFYVSQGGSTEAPLAPPFLAQYLGIDFVDSVSFVYFVGPEFDDTDLLLLNDLRTTTWLVLHETNVTGSGFNRVHSLRKLEKLTSTRSPLNDEGVAFFRGSALRKIHIEGAAISDLAFESLAQCKNLELLIIDDMPITDRGIQYLAGLESLNNVSLRRTQITDEALLVFANHPGLIQLKLRQNAITDVGLINLGRPPKLKHVYLDNTGVTPEGCARLRALYGGKTKVNAPQAWWPQTP